jgi:hypothetical protein
MSFSVKRFLVGEPVSAERLAQIRRELAGQQGPMTSVPPSMAASAAATGAVNPMQGDGLRRPMNAPSGYAPTVGVQPGTSNNIVRARLVIVSGLGIDGVFVYQAGTKPGLGNPPITWESSSLVDPYGNVLPSTTGVAGTGTFQAGNTIINPSGIFTYSSSVPAANNLISSSSATIGGQDSAGNWYLPGTVEYGADSFTGTGYIATQVWEGAVTWYYAATMTGVTNPWVAESSMSWTQQGLILQNPGGPVEVQAIGSGNYVSASSAGVSGPVVISQTSTATIPSGNVTAKTDITAVATAGSSDAGTIYEITTWFNGTWGGQLLTFYADINGAFTQVGLPVGAVFGTGVASGDAVSGWVRMVFQVVSATTMRIHLEGQIFDSTQNSGHISTSTQVGLGGTVATGVTFAAGDTLAIAIAFGGSTAGQTIITEGSELTIKLP